MSTTFALAIYFIIWWTTLFAVLPFGVRTQAEAGDVEPGTPQSAPSNLRLLRLFAINTIVASVVFAGVYWILVTPAARQAIDALMFKLTGIGTTIAP